MTGLTVEPGSIVLSLDAKPVKSPAKMYRILWGTGESGVEIRYTVLRNDDVLTIRATSGDRYAFLDLPQRH